MKILKPKQFDGHDDPRRWAGVKLQCSACESVFQLDESDHGYESMDMIWFGCPECRQLCSLQYSALPENQRLSCPP